MSPKIRAMSVYIDTLMPISSKKNKKDPRAIKNRPICRWTLKNDIFCDPFIFSNIENIATINIAKKIYPYID